MFLARVHVTVMNRSAIATDPFSYSKVFQSFRTADASAFGTDLSAEVFGGVQEHRCARLQLVAMSQNVNFNELFHTRCRITWLS